MRCLSSPLVDCPASCSGRFLQPFSSIYQPQRPRRLLHHANALINPQHSYRGEASGNGNGTQHAMNDEIAPKPGAPLIWTKFVAETLLPTGQGKFRLRGYRHTVRFQFLNVDLSFLATESTKNLNLLLLFYTADRWWRHVYRT
jgi:hypothetical protein